MITIDANANKSRGYAFYGPLNWSLEGADPGIAFDDANACTEGDLAVFLTSLLFAVVASLIGFDYAPHLSEFFYPVDIILLALFVWAMVARTRRVLSEPLLYPRKLAIAESVGYGVFFLLCVAFAAVFVRCDRTAVGLVDWTIVISQPNLIFVLLSLWSFLSKLTERTSAHARAIVMSNLQAGYIGKGRMGEEIKSVRKYAFEAYFWLFVALLTEIAVLAVLIHCLWWN